MEPEEAIDTGGLPQGDNEAVGTDQAPQPQGDDNSITPPGPARNGQDMPQDQAPAQGPEQKRFGPLGRIVSYLMGEGAPSPQVLQQAAQQIDPQGQMSPSDRNLMVIEDANKRGGPEAAWKMVQANRVAYNAKQAFGYAALNGNQQKPPDINAAIDAANKAAEHVLDGSNVTFAPGQGGVTATVKGADGQAQQFNLTPDQFRKYLNVGGAGQFDKQLQQGGIARTLMTLTQAPQQGAGAQQPQTAQAPAAPQTPEVRMGAKVDGFGPAIDSDSEYSPELQKRANRMFPPGAASNRDREEWMAKQLDTENQMQNKVDVAKETGENRVKAARETGRSRVEAQDSRNSGNLAVQGEKTKGWMYASDARKAAAQITADQKAAQAGSKEAQARIETARKAIATKRMTAGELSTDDKALEAQLTTAGQQANQRPAAPQAPQQPAAAPAAPGAPPVPGARQYKGQWYTRGANGEAVPVQQ